MIRLIREFLFLGVIIPPLPNTITNGQTIDAVPVMSNFNWIVSNVNTNSFDPTAPGPIGGTTPGAGTFTAIVANVSVSGGTGSFTTLSASANSQILATATGSDLRFLVQNNGNTAPSTASIGITAGGGADAFLIYTETAVTNWITGLDSSDSNTYKISASVALGTNDVVRVASTGVAVTGTLSATSFIDNAGNLIVSSTNPTIAGGFGTSPTILANNTAAFRVTVGSAPGNTGTVTMPAAPNGWACYASNRTNNAFQETVTSTTTSVTVVNWNRVNAADTNFGAGDVIVFECSAF